MNAQADVVYRYFRTREYYVRLEGELATLRDLRHKAKVMVDHDLDDGSWANDLEKLGPLIAKKAVSLEQAEDLLREAFALATNVGVEL